MLYPSTWASFVITSNCCCMGKSFKFQWFLIFPGFSDINFFVYIKTFLNNISSLYGARTYCEFWNNISYCQACRLIWSFSIHYYLWFGVNMFFWRRVPQRHRCVVHLLSKSSILYFMHRVCNLTHSTIYFSVF